MPRQMLSVESRIHEIRGLRVMLSGDLAALYGVPAKALVQGVKRNAERFPEDFMFQLTRGEFRSLKSQSVTSNRGGVRRAMPYAFTEQGVAMLSSILRSPKAVAVNVEIVRTFVRLRRAAVSFAELGRRLDALERRYDARFRVVFQALRELMQPPAPAHKAIGFTARDEDGVRQKMRRGRRRALGSPLTARRSSRPPAGVRPLA